MTERTDGESMVERVAKAMYADAEKRPDAEGIAWDDLAPMVQASFRRLARAAIEAMREPPEPDAEVWGCPCCNRIVDRYLMAALVETKEESHG